MILDNLSILPWIHIEADAQGRAKPCCLYDGELGDFSNTNFTGANLHGVNFTGANLKNANFTGSNLSNVNFTNASMSNAKFSSSNLANIDFNNIDISQASFEDIFFCGKRVLGKIRAGSIFDGIITEDKEDNISILMSLSCQ